MIVWHMVMMIIGQMDISQCSWNTVGLTEDTRFGDYLTRNGVLIFSCRWVIYELRTQTLLFFQFYSLRKFRLPLFFLSIFDAPFFWNMNRSGYVEEYVGNAKRARHAILSREFEQVISCDIYELFHIELCKDWNMYISFLLLNLGVC